MCAQDAFQPGAIDHILLKKLQDPGVVLGTPGLQSNCRQVLCSHHPNGDALDVSFNSVPKAFLLQSSAHRQELHRPPADYHVFPFGAAAMLLQIIVDGRNGNQQTSRSARQLHKYIDIQRSRGFQIQRRTNGAAYSIARNHAIPLHLVNELKGLFHWQPNGTQSETKQLLSVSDFAALICELILSDWDRGA